MEGTAAVDNARGLDFYRRLGAWIRERTRLCRLDATTIERLSQGRPIAADADVAGSEA